MGYNTPMRFPKPGTALGFLALFVALSGGAYAAISLPKNSVTTKQVKDRSLLARDFKRGQIPRGARGPVGPVGAQGIQGVQGAQGPPGPTNLSATQIVSGPDVPVCAAGAVSGCDVASSAATCPAGQHAVGGGMFEYTGGTSGHFEGVSTDRTAWVVGVANGSTFGGGDVQAVAYCATTGAAVTARHRGMTRQTARDIVRREARLRKR